MFDTVYFDEIVFDGERIVEVIHYGSATLSGVGALTGIGVLILKGIATLSGIGTLAAVGRTIPKVIIRDLYLILDGIIGLNLEDG